MNKQSIGVIRQIKDILKSQGKNLADMAGRINRNYQEAVSTIYRCKGKLIVTGIGKSGLIAQKIASTFSSTGTPSIFLHPAEALHGNLGIVNKNDVVFAIGKSGESEEVLAILPSIIKIGAKIISLTNNGHSSLARESDIVLEMSITREVCPYDLAPTTSTTVAMAIGDAIAITLMKMRKFGPDNFAIYHPGGLLGKRLLLKVSDVMRGGKKNPVVHIDASIHTLLAEISRKWTGAANVVDSKGKLLGLVTDYDVRQIILKRKSLMDMKIKNLMNTRPTTVYADESAMRAVQLMEIRKKPFTILPVVDRKKKSVGMVHLHDLVLKGLTKSPLDSD